MSIRIIPADPMIMRICMLIPSAMICFMPFYFFTTITKPSDK